jgi:hypothetical protein
MKKGGVCGLFLLPKTSTQQRLRRITEDRSAEREADGSDAMA